MTVATKVNWHWVVIACINLFLFGLSDNIRGPIFPEILAEFQLSHSRGSLFFAVTSLLTASGALLVPWVVRRTDKGLALLLFTSLLAVSQWGYFVSSSYRLVLMFAVLLGVAMGGLAVLQNLIVVASTPAHRRPQIQNGLHACYGASSVLAPGLVIALSLLGLTWRWSFLVTCLLDGLFAVLLVVWGRSRGGVLPIEEPPHLTNARYSRREAWYMALIVALYLALELLLSSRLAVLMREVRGLDLRDSSFWVLVFFGGLFFGRVVFSFVRPGVSLRFQLIVCLILTAVLIFGGVSWAPELLCLAGLTLAPFYPLILTGMSYLFHKNVDRATSLALALSGFAVVSMHGAVGWISDLYGIRMAYGLGLILTAIILLLILCYHRFFGRSIP
ncbi:MAG: hypothetical protein C5B49_10460 [Bdellovibrio sp.]|nr:MAG: hypothetical protein C5B49_10460 [Bdellovibrio sp.]